MELDKRFFILREQKDDLKKQLSAVQEQLDDTERELVEWLENNNLERIKGEHGSLYLRGEVYARVDDPSAAFDWLRSQNMGDVIKETVHAKTLAGIVKDHGEVPGVVAHYQTKIGVRTNNSNKGE